MQTRSRSFTTPALVLSHRNMGEQDRLVVLLSQTQGKIATIAKGVRKLNSTKKASLEAGNVVTAFCIETKSMPLLTQARLLSDCHQIRGSLQKMRQLSQLLEIIDRLFVNEELEPSIFHHVLKIRQSIVTTEPTQSNIFNQLDEMLVYLGYQPMAETKHSSILDYVAELTDKPMKSFDYLSVK